MTNLKTSHSRWGNAPTPPSTKEIREREFPLRQIKDIENRAIDYIEDIFKYFGAPVIYRNGFLIKSRCFVHGGDNNSALNLYYAGKYKIHFKCRTNGCELNYGNGLFDLIRGALEHKFNRGFNNSHVVKFIDKICGGKIKIRETKTKVIRRNTQAFRPIKKKAFYEIVTRAPSEYYLNRGFKKETLDKFCVGDCNRPGHFFCNRAIFPYLDDNAKEIIGLSGRSIYGQCIKCRGFHNPLGKCIEYPKWLNSTGFQKLNYLYNWWNAKEFIRESQTIVIVESPGNVWRLHEAKIYNSVALFGLVLSENQKSYIDSSDVLNVIVLMDNDVNGSGKRAAERIRKQLEKLYRVYVLFTKENDVADLTIDKVTSDIKPLIEKVERIRDQI